jgi:hypothetical protein
MRCDEFVEVAKTNPTIAEKMIIDFVLKEKKRTKNFGILLF